MNAVELAPRHRAHLFNTLLEQHRTQDDWDKLFQLLNQGRVAAATARMPEIAERMEEGQAIVLAGLRSSGKFLDWELSILEVGLATGNIAESYTRLRDHYLLQGRFAEELRQQSRWPLLMMAGVLALMYGWLAAIGHLSPVSAVALWLGVSTVLAGLLVALNRLAVKVLAGVSSRRTGRWMRILPLMAKVMRAEQLYQFFRNLMQSIEARLSLSQSLKIAAGKTPDAACQREFMAVYDEVNRGSKLSAALIQSRLLRGIALAPMSMRNAGAEQAMAHIADAVYSHYVKWLWLLARSLPQCLFVLLPVIALGQVLWLG